jgi:hypothetical protein
MKQIIRDGMSWGLMFALLAGLGCANFRKPKPAPSAPPVTNSSGTAPVQFVTITGKVTLVNKEQAFVVVDFEWQRPPVTGTTLTVRRANQAIGRVRLTEPVRGRFVTADIVEGEPRAGDEVR